MAAVTVTNFVDTVFGDRRIATANINVATSGDTWVVPNMNTINAVSAERSSAANIGVTFTGNTITFLSAADTAISVIVIGQ